MLAIRFFTPLALSSCALRGQTPALPITINETVSVHGYQYCTQAMSQVQVYLRHEGVNVMVRPGGESLFEITCVPVGPLALISPIGGLAHNTKGYAAIIGVPTLDAKTILHELLHTFAIGHSWRGVMFPVLSLHFLATGASDYDMQTLRKAGASKDEALKPLEGVK